MYFYKQQLISQGIMDEEESKVAIPSYRFLEQSNGPPSARPKFHISLFVKAVNPLTKKLSLGLDFTFNNLRNVT